MEPEINCLQGLGDLPHELVISILRGACIPTADQIRLLPSAFHTAAIYAGFPTIDADRSICVHSSDIQYARFAEALWPELSHITSFRRLHREVTLDGISAKAETALSPQLAKLSCLQHLDLSRNRLGRTSHTFSGSRVLILSTIF